MLFAEKLQILRKSNGYTQEGLAEKLGVSRQSIAKYEAGQGYPDILNLIQISNLFHVTVDYLVKDPECSVSIGEKDVDDIDELIQFRLEANNKKALQDDTHVAYLVFDGERFVGAGGVSFFQVMPTFHNPTGRKAYIMNMYTNPEYRRLGIAYKTLDLLVKEAEARGISAISLEATEMGRPLYEKYGFVDMKNEMELLG